MGEQKLVSVAESVTVEVFAKTEVVRLVHTDMELARFYVFGNGGKHIFDKLIGALQVDCEYIGYIIDLRVFAPVKNGIKVCKRLYAGNNFYAHGCGVFVYLAQFRFRVPAALVAEKRLARNLVGIFRIEHSAVIAHFRYYIKERFKPRNVWHGIARAIYHNAEIVEVFHKIPQSTVTLCAAGIFISTSPLETQTSVSVGL